ncbi:MAG TPA: galactokinase [Herpetosiphonaceae bacterium]
MPNQLPETRRVQLARLFTQVFDAPPTLFTRAPGRVNLIGEHTDYNEGFVLPAAINRAAYVAARPRDDRQLRLYARQKDEHATLALDELKPDLVTGWAAYIAGMADFLQQAGHTLTGADLMIDGDVPQGAGLSSSAALEMAIGATLLALAGHEIDRVQLAQVGQRTEHHYIHVLSGIMDQLISALGKANHALLIDCRNYSTQPLPLQRDVQIVVCNSKVKRELAHSGYNQRRAECDEAVRLLRAVLPEITTLRDVTPDHLDQHADLLPENVLKRARHVVTENARVLESAEVLRRGDLQRFGALMNEAHASYRDDFEASIREIEVLVHAAQTLTGVYGSRLTGGGWGGCTVSLVADEAVERFCSTVSTIYEHEVGYTPDIYVCTAADGVEVVPVEEEQTAT